MKMNIKDREPGSSINQGQVSGTQGGEPSVLEGVRGLYV